MRREPKSLLGSLHSLHKLLPNLEEITAPLRPLLSQIKKFIWTKECEAALDSLKRMVANITELKHFDIHRETRIVCDASHDELGAMVEQHSQKEWQPISLPSRYINSAERKYSTKELELLAVVCAKEH